MVNYRVTHLVLTEFSQFWQLTGRFCSYFLPRKDDRTSKIQGNQQEVLYDHMCHLAHRVC